MSRYLCIHGHFYQPPRENPWLEEIEVQDSAHPHHDWNERIARECYEANTASRILDGRGRIVEIVDNYRQISFNFGPTLLAWMERREPEVLKRIVEADRASARERSGHGNAMAQVYNHVIMPLATPRERETEVIWGLRDFRRRFGRDAEGMWCPETAVNVETLEELAVHGVKFTILAPGQARRVRPLRRAGDRAEALAGGEWQDVSGGRIDPSRPNLWRSPRRHSLALFFYDSPISHAVAFEGILNNGDAFASRLRAGFSPERDGAQLMHIATDGESYGHHHRFGDMALGFALKRLRESGEAVLTNYGEFLEKHPPAWEVEIQENSSWSCAHGVERWRSNCGCRLGGHAHWTQEWRGPLREALNRLAAALDDLFEARAGRYLRDVWAARNDSIDLVLDRGPGTRAAFFGAHASHGLSEPEQADALRLLEMQRQRLLMFTSCAWFFDEISGLESTTVLASAARALQIAGGYAEGARLEAEFVAALARARSNIPEFGNGAVVYERLVRPGAADLPRIVAHQALKALWRDEEPKGSVYSYDYEFLERHTQRAGGKAFSVGRIQVRSQVTLEVLDAAYAVLHMGGHDFHGVLKATPDPARFRPVRDRLLETFSTGTVTETLGLLAGFFEPRVFDLQDLLLEERRHILGAVIEGILARFEGTLRLLVDENKKLMHYLLKASYPLPHAFRLALESVLGRDLHRTLMEFQEEETRTDGLAQVHGDGRSFGVGLNWDGVGAAVRARLEHHLEAIAKEPTPGHARRALALLDFAQRLDLPLRLWAAENLYLGVWYGGLRQRVLSAPEVAEHKAYRELAERLRMAVD